MSGGWAIRLPTGVSPALAELRCTGGILASEQGDFVWLRGDSLSDSLQQSLRRLPAAERFTVDQQQRLIPAGHHVPTMRMPELAWRPLAKLLTIKFPPVGFGLQQVAPVTLHAVRDSAVQDVNLLLAEWEPWERFAVTAARVRLQPLRFACSGDRRVLIAGHPLPPVPGVWFVERQGIAVQAGWRWEPALDAAEIRECLQLEQGAVAILHSDGNWEIVPADAFVHASRAAVRATAEAWK